MGLDVFFLHSAGGYLQQQMGIYNNKCVLCWVWLCLVMVNAERSK